MTRYPRCSTCSRSQRQAQPRGNHGGTAHPFERILEVHDAGFIGRFNSDWPVVDAMLLSSVPQEGWLVAANAAKILRKKGLEPKWLGRSRAGYVRFQT